jgi:hypothetical protein
MILDFEIPKAHTKPARKVTHPFRFQTNEGNCAPSSLRSLHHSLSVTPELHFLSLSHVQSGFSLPLLTPQEMVAGLFTNNNLLHDESELTSGRMLASHVHFLLQSTEESYVQPLAQRIVGSGHTKYSFGHYLNKEVSERSGDRFPGIGTLVANSTSIRHVLTTTSRQFNKMFRVKFGVHGYSKR